MTVIADLFDRDPRGQRLVTTANDDGRQSLVDIDRARDSERLDVSLVSARMAEW